MNRRVVIYVRSSTEVQRSQGLKEQARCIKAVLAKLELQPDFVLIEKDEASAGSKTNEE